MQSTANASLSLVKHVVLTSKQLKSKRGSRVEIYWIHPQTKALTLMSTPNVLNGASFNLNSYIGHEFEIRELPSVKTGSCKGDDQTCRTNYLSVTENSEQREWKEILYLERFFAATISQFSSLSFRHKKRETVATLNTDFLVVFEDDQIRAKQEAQDIVGGCHEDAKAKFSTAKGDEAKTMAIMDELVKCVEQGVTNTISKANEELAFQGKVRKDMAAFMENYTCADLSLDTSPAYENTTWYSKKDEKKRKVQIMLERPASKIHVIENFIDEEECKAMEEAAAKKLHRATVADGKGGSHFSESRKAMQAGIKVPWHDEANGDLIAKLSRRVYDYAEHVLHLGIDEHGQEDLMSIQYFGRGINDTEPDRYTPHCDGEYIFLCVTTVQHKVKT